MKARARSAREARQFTARIVTTEAAVRIVAVMHVVEMSAVEMIGVMVVTGVDETKVIGLQSLAGAETIAGTTDAGRTRMRIAMNQGRVAIKAVKDADEWLVLAVGAMHPQPYRSLMFVNRRGKLCP